MDVRENLVELLQDENNPVWRWFPNNATMAQLADYIINSGVTVQEDCKECAEATQNCIVKLQEQIAELRSAQEWVSVKDKLPEKDGQYLIFTTQYFTPDHIDEIDHKDGIEISGYCKRFGFLSKNGLYAKYWCEMPQPPKGE